VGAEYERARAGARAEAIELRRRRRVHVGDLVSLVFENRQTLRAAAEESLRAERAEDPAAAAEEARRFTALLPEPGGLAASLYVDLADASELAGLVGDVDFEKADFAGTAEVYGRALRLDPKRDQVTVLYASALSASLPAKDALARFSGAAEVAAELRERGWFLEEQAGLKLMTGDGAAARSLVQELQSSEAEAAPMLLGRLGWWYYRFGDVTTAAGLIGQAVEERPQVAWLSAKLGWVLIAQKKYESAQRRFQGIERPDDGRTRAEIQMGIAVAAWLQGQPQLAVSNLRWAADQRSAWLKPNWVTAIYGPQAAATIQAIYAQSERQKKAQSDVKR